MSRLKSGIAQSTFNRGEEKGAERLSTSEILQENTEWSDTTFMRDTRCQVKSRNLGLFGIWAWAAVWDWDNGLDGVHVASV